MKSRKTLAVFALLISTALVGATAQADKRIKAKLHSAWGAAVPHLGTSGVRFAKNINRLSGGSFQVKFYEKYQNFKKPSRPTPHHEVWEKY